MSGELFQAFHDAFDLLATSDPTHRYVKWGQVEDRLRDQVSVAIGMGERVYLTPEPAPAPESKQTIEAQARMWQRRVGAILNLIEERAPELANDAYETVNTNWYSQQVDREGTAHEEALAALEDEG